MRLKTMCAVVFVTAAGPVEAQIGNPGFMAPGSADAPAGATAKTNTTDQLFARLAAAGGSGEVELARLAQSRARTSSVRQFADRMVADHTQANNRLTALARQANITLPRGIDPDQMKVRAELESVDPAVFDSRYMDAQVTDHIKTVQLLTWEIGQGQHAEIQRFAVDTLPVVLAHLDMARSLAEQLRATSPPPRAAASAAGPRR
jgi:putative membrane protein